MKSSNDKVAKQPLLVAGRDYPRTYREFVEMFPDDEACAPVVAIRHQLLQARFWTKHERH